MGYGLVGCDVMKLGTGASTKLLNHKRKDTLPHHYRWKAKNKNKQQQKNKQTKKAKDHVQSCDTSFSSSFEQSLKTNEIHAVVK